MELRRRWIRVLATGALIALAACSGGGGGGDGGGGTITASLTVVNSTSRTLNGVYLSPPSQSTWGANQLGGATIAPGASFTITNIPAGTYDLRATATTGAAAETYGMTLAAGVTYTWTVTESTGNVKVVNNYPYPITELYVSPSGSASWGVNQLGSSMIPNGESFTVTSIPVGIYDLKAVASDGAVAYEYGISVTAGGTYTWTLTASTGNLHVVNNYQWELTELYVTPAGSPSWGVDQVATIPSGSSFTLTAIPPGIYDFKVVAPNGTYATQYGIYIGAGATVTWTISAGPTGTLQVVNYYPYAITEVYIAPYQWTTWGPDVLSGTIPYNYYSTWTVPEGQYDLMAVASDGAWATTYGVVISAGVTTTWTLSPALLAPEASVTAADAAAQ